MVEIKMLQGIENVKENSYSNNLKLKIDEMLNVSNENKSVFNMLSQESTKHWIRGLNYRNTKNE